MLVNNNFEKIKSIFTNIEILVRNNLFTDLIKLFYQQQQFEKYQVGAPVQNESLIKLRTNLIKYISVYAGSIVPEPNVFGLSIDKPFNEIELESMVKMLLEAKNRAEYLLSDILNINPEVILNKTKQKFPKYFKPVIDESQPPYDTTLEPINVSQEETSIEKSILEIQQPQTIPKTSPEINQEIQLPETITETSPEINQEIQQPQGITETPQPINITKKSKTKPRTKAIPRKEEFESTGYLPILNKSDLDRVNPNDLRRFFGLEEEPRGRKSKELQDQIALEKQKLKEDFKKILIQNKKYTEE